MEKFRSYGASIVAVLLVAISSCNTATEKSNSGYTNTLSFSPGEESKISEALLSLKDSSVVELKAGNYKFDNLSIAQLKHIMLKGEGPDKTILDFSSQTQGGEGIRVTDVTGFNIEDIKLQNAKGDLIKVTKSRDVVFRNVHAVWDKSDSSSGGYALYPVMCKNVLLENCYVQGSSDAGIYVGQTDSAVVRNCKGFRNVAGCEIENTTNAEVYGNEFWGNCAGFLVFDLPTLSKRGGHVKAHDNNIHDNNERNFAKAGSFGTTWGVGNAAPGSGVIILAASDIELYNNQIVNNNSGAILLASGLVTDDSALNKINDNYFPISKNIFIHDNTLQMGDAFPAPALEHHMGKMLVGIEQALNMMDTTRKNKRIPLILYDGISTNIITGGQSANPDSLCIKQTGDNVFVNADMLHIQDQKNWKPNIVIDPFVCK
ncbi:MAG TPA: parallel beta-helix domain-containing protein [Panacibacter sp.]|nr:parallel beta-helix domain-containing protein [Panacibacter sp.]HNP46036.1 parallel beta-helix domain-containing protein [Panacibacter sp.]